MDVIITSFMFKLYNIKHSETDLVPESSIFYDSFHFSSRKQISTNLTKPDFHVSGTCVHK